MKSVNLQCHYKQFRLELRAVAGTTRALARNNFLPVLGDPTFPAGGPLAASGSDGHDGRYCGSIYFRRNCTVTIGSTVVSVQLDCD